MEADAVVKLLREWDRETGPGSGGECRVRDQRRQQEERDNGGDRWNPDNELVSTDEVGNPLNPDRLTREFERQVRLAKLRPIRLHDLRNTYAPVIVHNRSLMFSFAELLELETRFK